MSAMQDSPAEGTPRQLVRVRCRPPLTPLSSGIVKLSLMDSQTFRENLDRWYKALSARNIQEMAALLAELADAEIVLEYPQSGERSKGRENNLAILENYPGLPDVTIEKVRGAEDKWVLTPSWTPLRITGTGDNYTVEGRLVYPNGDVGNVVDLFDLRNDKLIMVFEYFVAPVLAVDWRSKWVEKLESPIR